MRYLYIILFYLLLPFAFLRLLWRSRKAVEYRQGWAQRLGFCPHKLNQCIWVHAASVGETIAAIPLIKALKLTYPNLPILITNMTITGYARTQAAFGESVLQAYVPYDLPDAANRFLNRINPVLVIVMETELWPNLFLACYQRHIPIVVANARLSEQSAQGYKRVGSLIRQMLNTIHTIAVQTKAEAQRFIDLGLPPLRSSVTGSIKFDVEVPVDLAEKGEFLRNELGNTRKIWIAASTHQGEEEIILAVHKTLLTKFPELLLVLVPRHPERFNAVFTLALQQGFKVARRSLKEICEPDTQIYLGDTMGELLLLYSASDIAFVAGSFVPVGGHNMLEAAVLGKPVLTGPYLFNFAEISQMLLNSNAMLKAENEQELIMLLEQLLQDEQYCLTVGENARAVVACNRGAVAKHIELIKSAYPI